MIIMNSRTVSPDSIRQLAIANEYSLATNMEGPDQTPRILRGVWPESSIFVAP